MSDHSITGDVSSPDVEAFRPAEEVLEEEKRPEQHTSKISVELTADEATEIAIDLIDLEYSIDSDNSPFPEVRANVPNTDDPSLPVNTVRMWFLGIVFTMIGSGINQFFSMRYPSVTITSLVAQLISYPIGCALAKALPIKTVRLFGRWDLELNPDHHFNIKEHAVITIMSNLSFGASWATDIIQAQKAFYHSSAPVGYQFLLGLTMQLLGLGLAGLTYRFIVEPPQMIWPSTLANAALFETLHGRANPITNGWRVSRYRFFSYVFIASFCWYWFPGFIFTGLSTFAFICWAAPSKLVLHCAQIPQLTLNHRQHGGQQPVWNVDGLRPHAHDVRLVSDCIQRLATCRALLGSSECLCGLAHHFRNGCPYPLLHQYMVCSRPSSAIGGSGS